MSEHYCPECAEGWNGAYTCELRCTTCGSALKVRDCDLGRLNPEVEIKELNAVIAQLTERADKAERERDALAAHVGRLRRAGDGLYHELEQWALTEQDPESVAAMKGWASETLNQTPATSLGRLKAQWQADTARAIYASLCEGAARHNQRKAPTARQAVDNMLSLARQEVEKREPLRRQAEAQPHSVEDDV